jgi:hypothetical protein
MRRIIFLFLLVLLTFNAFAQTSSIKGVVQDENNIPLEYAPVVLLFPADSTLAFYGVTNDEGKFEIKSIRQGKYLLQATLMGHQTEFREISIPFSADGNIGVIILKSSPVKLGEVVVSEERVPMKFKRDTIEYNTASYLTKPDAVVEDLLKKLPGIDIDRSGNIKAMGEDIKRVLVDGREFFGSDQKLATRNVPADALKKVQIFDKKSDESEFTGIDDGKRDKTINLLLKDDRKNAVFGELLGGAGNSGFYQGSAKAYKFTEKNQFAALGMINNINQFGFSFKDYIDFNGGIQSLGGHSGAVQIKIQDGSASSFPVNFGQPVTGLSTAGAAGLNFSRQFKKDSRIFMSYIANGSDRKLNETTSSRNYTESGAFQQEDSLKEDKSDRVHRINFGYKNRIDSTRNVIINGGVSLATGRVGSISSGIQFDDELLQNRLTAVRNDEASRLTSNISGSYLKLLNKGKTVFKVASDASYLHDIGNNIWINNTYQLDQEDVMRSQFQDNTSGLGEFSATTSFTVKAGKALYLEPELKIGSQVETLDRTQGIPSESDIAIDSLSPEFINRYQWFRPEIRLIRNTEKVQFSLGLQMELGNTANSLNDGELLKTEHVYFTPDFSWEYEYKTGRRLRAYFQTMVNVPSVNQLLPVVNNSNPLSLSSGNRYLKPELDYNLSLNWWIFDQFSFTSLLMNLSGAYTKDKINWNKTIDDNFMQSMFLMNVQNDYRIRGNVAFSTPVRKLGIKVNADLEEGWNRGLSYINQLENVNTNFSHKFSLSIENRKKTKADIIVGGSIEVMDARFSIQESLNDDYLDFSWFTVLSYNPDKHWNLQFSSDVTHYNTQSFARAVTIPLIGAEISRYFLKNNRGTITLQGSDLLNRNTGIDRTTESNYLREKRSNMLGRFFMLSFKYKLNKSGNSPGGVDVKFKKH